jgi:Xaa-Pro dipeptidase
MPALHFPVEEFDRRVASARAAMKDEGLDGLIMFNQNSHYYLTGFDNAGWVFFQCTVLTAASDDITLICRPPDYQQALRTSTITDVRIWRDAEGYNPATLLREVLEEKGLKGGKVGIELDTWGLTGQNHARVEAALEGFCTLVDASMLIRRLRVIKSPAEIAHHRKAAELMDMAMVAMLNAAGPGVYEGDVIAAAQDAVLKNGGDISKGVLGSGDRALLVRDSTGFTTIGNPDQLTIEWGAPYKRHWACLMRTVAIGKGDDRQRRMFDVTLEAINAMTEAATPGRPVGEIDDAHRRVFDAHGFEHARLAACGYSLGATYGTTWMDPPPMLYSGNPTVARPGMVLFMHAVLADARTNLAMSLGHTVVITETGREVLSKLRHEYTVCG